MLEELASSISAHEATLARLTGSERALKYRLTLYTTAFWVAYAAVWYTGVLGRAKYLAAPLVLLPALCVDHDSTVLRPSVCCSGGERSAGGTTVKSIAKVRVRLSALHRAVLDCC